MLENQFAIVDIKKQINLSDKQFKISLSKKDIKPLTESIKNTGLINPVLLRPVGNEKFVIISGFNRVSALVNNNIAKAPAYVVSKKTNDQECFKKAIAAVAFKRPLTHAELILSIKHLISFCDIKTIIQMAPAVFNLQLNKSFLQDLLQISKMPEPCIELIQKEHLTIKSARRLSDFNPRTTDIFLDLFSKIKASSSKQLEIITYIKEITARDVISVSSLYDDDQFQKILLNPDVPSGIKTNEIRLFLYEKRFPAIFKTRRKVDQQISDLKLGNSIKLVPPENLEGTDFLLSFKAKNLEEFNARLHKLNRISTDKNLEQVFIP